MNSRPLMIIGGLGFGLIVLVGIFFALFQNSTPGEHVRTTADVDSMLASGVSVVVLDVRTAEEYSGPTGHLQSAILIPVQELEKRISELEPYRGQMIVVYCRTQNRSSRATEILRARGFNAITMAGGISHWNQEGRAIVHEEHP